MRWRTIAIACLGLAALSAGAQVHRCKDIAGKTFYSDRPCDAGQSGQMIERPRSQAEIMRERDQAYEAELRKQDRRMTEQERALAQQQMSVLQAPPPAALQPTQGWQERKDRENAATSAASITRNGSSFDEQAEAERARARREEARRRGDDRPPPPSVITHCSGGACYDNMGGVYHRRGNDFLTGPQGQTCTHQGVNRRC